MSTHTTTTFSVRPMSVADFASAAGVSFRHIQRQIAEGKIAVNKIGTRVIIPASEVTRLLAEPTQ